MKTKEIVEVTDKEVAVFLHLVKRRKNPRKSKKQSIDQKQSFIDMFGGVVGYAPPDSTGSVSPDTN